MEVELSLEKYAPLIVKSQKLSQLHPFYTYYVKVKEADLYSAFIEVPYTQGAQVRITQCYLQTTPYLPLPRKQSPDGASQTEVADIYCSLLLICLPRKDERLGWPGWLVT